MTKGDEHFAHTIQPPDSGQQATSLIAELRDGEKGTPTTTEETQSECKKKDACQEGELRHTLFELQKRAMDQLELSGSRTALELLH